MGDGVWGMGVWCAKVLYPFAQFQLLFLPHSPGDCSLMFLFILSIFFNFTVWYHLTRFSFLEFSASVCFSFLFMPLCEYFSIKVPKWKSLLVSFPHHLLSFKIWSLQYTYIYFFFLNLQMARKVEKTPFEACAKFTFSALGYFCIFSSQRGLKLLCFPFCIFFLSSEVLKAVRTVRESEKLCKCF